MDLLTFTVPPFSYIVRITADRPKSYDGQQVAALIDTNEGVIYLWAGLSPASRENALRHEVWHGWEYHYLAEDAGEERRAQMFANASQHFDAELSAQGGRGRLAELRPELASAAAGNNEVELPVIQLQDNLPADVDDEVHELRLEPAESAERDRADTWGTAHRRDCPSCGSYIWGGSIVTTREPYYLDIIDGRPVEGWVVDRACVCGACDVMSEWIEGVGPYGQPNCVPVAEPVQTSMRTKEGRLAVNNLMRQHPKLGPLPLAY